MIRVLAMAAVLSGTLAAQDPDKPSPTAGGVNEVRVTQAIDKGIAFLKTAPSPDFAGSYGNSDELILWTFIHAGVPPTEPRFRELFTAAAAAPMKRTYKVALLAMCLEEMDRAKYQDKIAQCAQFLVDTQCTNGQWGYGNKVESVKDVPVPAPEVSKDVPTAPAGKPPVFGAKAKPAAKKLTIKKTADGPEAGDNSNSQYAALGLRACHDAGIVIPEATISAAVKAWKASLFNEADRSKAKDAKKSVASSGGSVAEGWNYKTAEADERAPYHAMTAGGVGAMVIYLHLQKKNWKSDPAVEAGMKWLTDKFKIEASNPYYMYALERAGILYGTETFGSRPWYREGAYAILGVQKADGSWGEDLADPNGLMWYGRTWDTCFSILFLRRATRPLVASTVAPK